MAILCIGESNYTIYSKVEESIKEGNLNFLNNRVDFTGGLAGNTCYLLGKWGVESYIGSMIGSDDYGQKIKKEFESVQVKTEYLETNYENPTILAINTFNEKDNVSTEINISKNKQLMKKADFKITPEIIFTDCYDYGASAKAMNLHLKVPTIVAVTSNTPETRELCKHGTYLLFKSDVAESITGLKINYEVPNSLVKLYTALKEKYPNGQIIIALEEHGSLYAINNEVKMLPTIKSKIVSKSNYLCSYCGAFIYGLLKQFTIEKALIYANITGSIAMEEDGNKINIPALKDVITIYNEKFPAKKTDETENKLEVL